MSKSLMHTRDLSQDRRIRHASVNVAASQSLATLIAAPSSAEVGLRIAVLGLVCLTGGTATEATLFSGTTAISPLFANGANSGIMLPSSEHPWFVCRPGEAMKVTTGAGSATGFQIVYALIS